MTDFWASIASSNFSWVSADSIHPKVWLSYLQQACAWDKQSDDEADVTQSMVLLLVIWNTLIHQDRLHNISLALLSPASPGSYSKGPAFCINHRLI